MVLNENSRFYCVSPSEYSWINLYFHEFHEFDDFVVECYPICSLLYKQFELGCISLHHFRFYKEPKRFFRILSRLKNFWKLKIFKLLIL